MQLFDTHCHYNLEPFNSQWQQQWANAQQHGVVGSVVIGTDLETSRLAIDIAGEDKRLGATVGYHPDEWVTIAVEIWRQVQNNTQFVELVEKKISTALNELSQLWDEQKVVAVGETGLDYFRLDTYSAEEKTAVHTVQQWALRTQMSLAQQKKVPLILHVRDRADEAYWDVLQLLRQTSYSGQFILHCVSGPLTYIEEAIELGAYISVAGNVTYKNADSLRQLVRAVPHDRLLIETDAPFLPPVPFRGKVCEPWMIMHTAEFLARELQIDTDQCVRNAQVLFPRQF